MPWHGQGPRQRHGSRFPSPQGAGCRAPWSEAKCRRLQPRQPDPWLEMLAGLPGPAQGCNSVRGALPRSRRWPADLSRSPGEEPEPSRLWAARSQAPVGRFVPALSQWPMLPSPLMLLETELCNQLMEKLVSHKNSPKQPECCVMTTFGCFLLFFFNFIYFLLKPENTVASAEGTGIFPD